MATPEQTNTATAPTDEVLVYCTVHPTIATNLRCNRCGRPMCTRCAVRTPVGYRCRECVREQQNKFFDAQALDYILAAVVSVVMSFFAAAIIGRMGWFIGFFLSPAAGGAIASVVAFLTRRRRGRYTALVVSAGVVVGALATLPFLPYNLFGVGIYLLLATGAAAARFRLRL